MNVDEIDFGAEDARNLRLKTHKEKEIFLSSYILPATFKLNDFIDGYKCFVFGRKGAGKTALLQYIRISAEINHEAESSFFYFQSSFSKEELKIFHENSAKGDGQIVNDSNLYDADESTVFWKLLLLSQTAKLLRSAGVIEGPADEFAKLVEAAKLISQAKNVGSRYPTLQKFSITLSKDPQVKLDGTFENATVTDLATYLNLSEERLETVYLDNKPLFIFIDEMEVYLKGDETDALRLSAVASLVRAVRDFNERFYRTRIRVIAAIRDAVVNEVSSVQGEVYRIIRDKGVQLDWPETVKHGLHPLERMVLRRILVQDPTIRNDSASDQEPLLRQVLSKYFPNKYGLRKCLDLTWYRPRDIALLFEEASVRDRGKDRFSSETLSDGVVKSLGKRLWQDAISGLSVKYIPEELSGIDRIFRGGKEHYSRNSLIKRMDSLSDMYDDVAILSDKRWLEVIEDLYRVGAVYSQSINTGHKNFCFRGDEMPSLTEDFMIGVHKVLRKELSIQSETAQKEAR